ncbi:MAG TPA: shikimate kinase [Acidimicrobiia bacterium]|nr:shikimate kinase [Acidimicrobiia bacterium]
MAGSTDHVVIVGSMASGKTTVGRGIAERLGLAFVDSDDQIRDLTGADGARIAATDGVEALHRLELEVFWKALQSPQPTVITAAASVIEDEAVRDALRRVRCVWVDASEETLRGRRSSSSHRREITDDEARRLAAREPLFASCAEVTVDTGSVTEHDAVSIAVEAITGGDGG